MQGRAIGTADGDSESMEQGRGAKVSATSLPLPAQAFQFGRKIFRQAFPCSVSPARRAERAARRLRRRAAPHPRGRQIPIIQAIKDLLGVDSLLLGLGLALPDCQIHAPNENFTVSNFEAGIRLNQALLRELGG